MTDAALKQQAVRLGKQAKIAARQLAPLSSAEKNRALLLMADQLEAKSGFLIEENQKDLAFARAKDVSSTRANEFEIYIPNLPVFRRYQGNMA